MLPIAETDESATTPSAGTGKQRRNRIITAEMRAVRRRRGWTVVGSETSW